LLARGKRLTGSFATIETHQLTQVCWTKCVPGAVKSGKLDKTEETCLANCVNRFMDLNLLTVKHLQNMRSN
jgi:import inner membrane translocase subunit TIM8